MRTLLAVWHSYFIVTSCPQTHPIAPPSAGPRRGEHTVRLVGVCAAAGARVASLGRLSTPLQLLMHLWTAMHVVNERPMESVTQAWLGSAITHLTIAQPSSESNSTSPATDASSCACLRPLAQLMSASAGQRVCSSHTVTRWEAQHHDARAAHGSGGFPVIRTFERNFADRLERRDASSSPCSRRWTDQSICARGVLATPATFASTRMPACVSTTGPRPAQRSVGAALEDVDGRARGRVTS